VQRGVVEGKIAEGHARAILGIAGPERQLALYKMILDQGLNVRQVEAKVRELMARPRLEAAGPDPRVAALEGMLRSRFGTRVKIEKRGRGGKIMIEFFSEEELDKLIGRLENGPDDEAGDAPVTAAMVAPPVGAMPVPSVNLDSNGDEYFVV
jgi:ParB family chromosome partitioning protein